MLYERVRHLGVTIALARKPVIDRRQRVWD
jgi:hypothetical protein